MKKKKILLIAATQMYVQENRNPADIAKRLNMSIETIKSWKKRHRWQALRLQKGKKTDDGKEDAGVFRVEGNRKDEGRKTPSREPELLEERTRKDDGKPSAGELQGAGDGKPAARKAKIITTRKLTVAEINRAYHERTKRMNEEKKKSHVSRLTPEQKKNADLFANAEHEKKMSRRRQRATENANRLRRQGVKITQAGNQNNPDITPE